MIKYTPKATQKRDRYAASTAGFKARQASRKSQANCSAKRTEMKLRHRELIARVQALEDLLNLRPSDGSRPPKRLMNPSEITDNDLDLSDKIVIKDGRKNVPD